MSNWISHLNVLKWKTAVSCNTPKNFKSLYSLFKTANRLWTYIKLLSTIFHQIYLLRTDLALVKFKKYLYLLYVSIILNCMRNHNMHIFTSKSIWKLTLLLRFIIIESNNSFLLSLLTCLNLKGWSGSFWLNRFRVIR